MGLKSPHQRPAAVGALLSHYRRVEPGGLALSALLGCAAAVVGLWIGLDLRGQPALAIGRGLFVIVVAAAAPLPLTAVGCLYHHPLHGTILSWPVDGWQHFRIGVRLMATGHWPWLVLAVTAAGAATVDLGPLAMLCYTAFITSSVVGAALISLGMAGLCAALADAEGPRIESIRHSLAGSFASQRHAPFFYLPALAFAAAVLAASAAEQAAASLLHGSGPPTWRALAQLSASPVIGILTLMAGARGYAKHGLRVIPRVREEALMIYGGHPAPAEPPYGLWLSRLLPRAVAPHYRKELREQGRGQRGLWAWIILALVGALLYGIRTGAPLRAAPVLGLVLVVWAATLPLRRSARLAGSGLLLTLPIGSPTAWLGRWLALVFVASHLTLAVALALNTRHGLIESVLMLLIMLVSTLLAAGATQPRAQQRWTAATQLVPALAIGAGLVALSWPLGGLIAVAAVGLVAFAWGICT